MSPNTLSRSVLHANCILQASKCSPLSKISVRHESSFRRHAKRLMIQPPPSFLANTSTPASTHVIFNPPPTTPNVYHTPLKFLPPDDMRRALYTSGPSLYTMTDAPKFTASPVVKPGTALHESTSTFPASLAPVLPAHAPLPPPIKEPSEKKYHLTPAEIAEIRSLRLSDPKQWTRNKLAEKFGCSEFFVSLIAKNKEAGLEAREKEDAIIAKWGPRRRQARLERRRRKELWGRDA
ncbi:hypothetical protein EJ06DRAFT_527393 [Trichodelitschia bisporula]|uniref:60S ribosomal protein L20 n=1 Tax=Trichodelitschia bisporula TaxID=703511 RepID=A0A6G1I668_9PEZI|nr:hypothetical protein EJ06DRAFT_527393 [Trichodelitschia bisporula]